MSNDMNSEMEYRHLYSICTTYLLQVQTRTTTPLLLAQLICSDDDTLELVYLKVHELSS